MLDVDTLLRPFWDSINAAHGPLSLFDAHTHIGQNDPDGFKQTPAELIEVMTAADARAVTFPSHEPDGYPGPNDASIAAALASDGRLVSFCRLDPRVSPAAEARRCLDAGAVGIKLHPRAEQFTMAEPGVRAIVEVAHERRVPVLIHAGRGIPALGRDTLSLSSEFPDARLHPRPRRDLRPRVAVAGAARPPERLHRHRLVEPGRPHRAVLAGRSVAHRLGVGLAIRPAAAGRLDARARRVAGGRRRRGAAVDHGRPDRAAGRGRGPAVGRRRAGRRQRPRCTRCSIAS